nr:mating type protein [Hapsidospora chrysogena]
MDANLDYPITFVKSNSQRDIHVFVPETFEWVFVEEIARNFSRQIQQQVKVYHEITNNKFRLCPMPDEATVDSSGYGLLLFTCDETMPKAPGTIVDNSASTDQEGKHIPRPPNSWILFRQAKSKELINEYPRATASELSTIISKMWREASPEERQFWYDRAKEQDRLHKEMYPGYKFTIRKSSQKERTHGS